MTTPGEDLHAALIAHLARTLPLDAGLARIVTGPTADAARGDDLARHDRLVAHLTSVLDVRRGLTAILSVEGGHTNLIHDLSGTLDTERGLAAILSPESGQSPPPGLADVYAAADPCRLSTRALGPHRDLDRALRELRSIRDRLTEIPLSLDDDPTAPNLTDIPATLFFLQAYASHASRVLGNALTTGGAGTDPQENLTVLSMATTMYHDVVDAEIIDEGEAPTSAPSEDVPTTFTLSSTSRIASSIVMGAGGGGISGLAAAAARITAAAITGGAGMPALSRRAPVASEVDVDREALAEAAAVLGQLAAELGEIGVRVADFAGVMGAATWRRCRDQFDGLIGMLEALGTALSDFRGADLRPLLWQPSLEDLDGVCWSDATATGGATRWPESVRALVADPLVSEPTTDIGVYVVRHGTVVGTGR